MKPYKNLFITALTLAALTAGSWAQTATTKKKTAVAKPAEPVVTAADVQSLKDAIAAQQQQIQQLTQQMQQSQQAWQQSQQQLQQAQSAAQDASQKTASLQAATDRQQSTVAKLSSDVADVKTTVSNSVMTTQEEQKKFSILETAFARFRFAGDMRVRGEDYFQRGVADRNRARMRVRFGVESRLNDDFLAGLWIATGSLGDPSTTNETFTNFFDRKTIGVDRAYITYNPAAHKWLSLTGGKFATPWARTSLTFDPDISPEGFNQKLSFDTHKGPIRNFTAQGIELAVNESKGGSDSWAFGGSVSSKMDFGFWQFNPSYTILNWHLADQLLSASAFAVQSTTTGVTSTNTNNGNVPGEGPGCASVWNGTAYSAGFPACVFAPNGMTNATFADSKGVNHFLSKFLYSDLVLNNTFKTGVARMPLNLMAEYEQNLNAAANPFDAFGNVTARKKQNKSYGIDLSVGRNILGGQSKDKNDVQVGYSWWRIEQDAIIASFAESDQRAPTNILQNRFYAAWKIQKNVTAQYTMWFGRTLDSNLENNAALTNSVVKCTAATAPCVQEPTLKRQQIDLIYSF